MKQILHTLVLGGSLFALAGCAATDIVEESGIAPETGNVTLIATLEQGGINTRTGHEEATDGSKGIKVTWAAGDAFKIISADDKTKFATFALTGLADDGVSGIFSGKAEPASSTTGHLALYPATATFDADGNVRFDMTGQTQWSDGNMAHLGAYDVMYTYIADNNWKSFSFVETDHKNALMTFDLSNIPADLGRPQNITLGCTGTDACFYVNTSLISADMVPTLELKLTGFANPTEGTPVGIKAYLMMVGYTSISAGESLIITVKGEKNSYTFTAPAMTEDMEYMGGKRYTATASAWTKVFSGDTYTGAEPAEAFTGGDGTAAKPYEIGSAGQLRTLVEGVNSGANDGYKGKFFKLTTDIRIAMKDGGAWTPIGKSDNIFKGNFNGDGHTISGSMTGTADNFGFFGYTSGVTITNLTVDATVSGGKNVGGIVGQTSTSTRISNCTNKGTVTGASIYIGGIVGFGHSTTISNCTNLGAITVTAGSGFSGGIVGGLESSCIILGCINQGAVLGQAGQYFGGIVGLANSSRSSSVIACYNTAAVTVPAYYGGGIVGGLTSSCIATACYNTGKIAQGNNGTTNIGTIAGKNDEGNTVSYCQWVLDAENTGLPAFPDGSSSTTSTENTVRANLAALNAAGVTALNKGITAWNTANAAGTAKHCAFHFVASTTPTTAGPTLAPGVPAPPAPPSSDGNIGNIGDGSAALPQ